MVLNREEEDERMRGKKGSVFVASKTVNLLSNGERKRQHERGKKKNSYMIYIFQKQ